MSTKYDPQIKQFESTAQQSKQEEEALLAQIKQLNEEIQKLQSDMSRLEAEKKQIQNNINEQNAQYSGNDGEYTAKPDNTALIQRLQAIEKEIGEKASSISALQAVISTKQSHAIPAVQQKLSAALGNLSNLEQEVSSGIQQYTSNHRDLKYEAGNIKSADNRKTRSYIDSAANEAYRQYKNYTEKLIQIRSILSQYQTGSKYSSGASISTSEEYSVNNYKTNNYSPIIASSIDSAVSGNYNNDNRINSFDQLISFGSDDRSTSGIYSGTGYRCGDKLIEKKSKFFSGIDYLV